MSYGHGKNGHIHPRTRSAYAASLVRGFLWDKKPAKAGIFDGRIGRDRA